MLNKENLQALADVVHKSADIEQLIYLTELKGKDYILDYKLRDLRQIQSLIKKCVRCGEYFIPNPNTKRHQVYCGVICRNQATRINRYIYHLDEFQKPVDLLRKQIYERKYRANRDGKYFNLHDYEVILRKLSTLLSQRNKVSKEEYFTLYNLIYKEYEEAVKRQKANT